MQVAIPVLNGKLSEYLSSCSHFEIYGVESDVAERSKVLIPAGEINGELPDWLEAKGVTDIIIHKVKPEIIHKIVSKKVNVYVGVSIDSTMNLIEAIILGRLESGVEILQELTSVEEDKDK